MTLPDESIYKISLRFTESLLGTVALDQFAWQEYQANDVDDDMLEEERETLPEPDEDEAEPIVTGFHVLPEDGRPCLYDYMIKGFFKEALGMLRRVRGTRAAKIRAYKKVIDGLLFVEPRRIPVNVNGEIEMVERPLRAQTARGERVALARSKAIPAGSTMEFYVHAMGPDLTRDLIVDLLDYGARHGLGQWRSGGWGTFTYEIEEVTDAGPDA